MAERKVKCVRCGKWFKAADYRHTLCPACTAAERISRALSPVGPARPANPPAPVRGEAPPAQQPVSPVRRGVPHASPPAGAGTIAQATEPVSSPGPSEEAAIAVVDTAAEGAGWQAARRPAELSAAERQAVEARYLELATPHEFDGIRSQIAEELHLRKTLVKRTVQALRLRLNRPSWWEERQVALAPEVIDAVRPRYVAVLAESPLPPVGIHNQLAEELGLTSLQVYRAIGRIRADLGLSRFNERPEELAEAEAAQAPEIGAEVPAAS